MSYVIAIAGKGGTGKSTITAMLIRLLKETRAGSILAVDADPNSNLAELLGVKTRETVGEILDRVASSLDKVPSGMSKDRYIEFEVGTSLVEGDGFDLLTMGRPEGPGCYCYVNNVLRNITEKLIAGYDYVLIDNEAGLEHLSRRTTRKADALLVVSDTSAAGLRAAKRINSLVKELKIDVKKRFLLVNRVVHAPDDLLLKDTELGHLGNIIQDESILQISLKGGAVFLLEEKTESLAGLRDVLGKIL
ncbi:MAG: AAA family ATPase [Candidatus Omnitrophica bacterium]|nr:AAA family ATPase [Candidatus Omnitrophota bacterium]